MTPRCRTKRRQLRTAAALLEHEQLIPEGAEHVRILERPHRSLVAPCRADRVVRAPYCSRATLPCATHLGWGHSFPTPAHRRLGWRTRRARQEGGCARS